MRVESAAGKNGTGYRGVRALGSGTDNPVAMEPRDRDRHASRVDGASRRHRAGGGEGGEKQREAQALAHVRSMPQIAATVAAAAIN